MIADDHRLISDLSEEYADRMTKSDTERTFSRGCIAAAYIIGAEETLRRVCNVIRQVAIIGGIPVGQSEKLLRAIEKIESMPYGNNNKTH